MANFKHFLAAGILWTLISLAIGWWGLSLTDDGGIWSVLGWLIALVALGFVILSLILMGRTVFSYRQGMRWMKEDPEGFAKAQQAHEAAVQQLVQRSLAIVSEDEFARRTEESQPSQTDLSAYEGCRFLCACGKQHLFYSNQIAVLRELPGMRLVFACPDSEGVTCVRAGGMLWAKGFESLFGARAVPDWS